MENRKSIEYVVLSKAGYDKLIARLTELPYKLVNGVLNELVNDAITTTKAVDVTLKESESVGPDESETKTKAKK